MNTPGENIYVCLLYLFMIVTLIWLWRFNNKNRRCSYEEMSKRIHAELNADEQLMGHVIARLRSLGKEQTLYPCVIGITNKRLFLALTSMNFIISPAKMLTFPLADITSCSVKPSIVPFIPIVRVAGKKLILEATVNKSYRENKNSEIFFEQLGEIIKKL